MFLNYKKGIFNSKEGKNFLELVLLFAVFFLPSYLSQRSDIDATLFGNIVFHINYILLSFPQIFLLLYIIKKIHTDDLSEYGITGFKISVFIPSLLTFVGTYGVLLFLFFSVSIFTGKAREILINPVNWKIEDPRIFPLIFLTCIVAGYREELFFRAYLITNFKRSGLNTYYAVTISVVLFSMGHLYQGVVGFWGTALIGLYFSLIFLRCRNVHIIAIAHGLYNFTTLLLIYFYGVMAS